MACRRLLTFALLGILSAASLAAAPVSSAATESREPKTVNCKQLNKKYPQGITSSKSNADSAVSSGLKRPAVGSSAFYSLYGRVAQSSRTAINTVLCPVMAFPEVVSGAVAETVRHTSAMIVWDQDPGLWPAEFKFGQDPPRIELSGPGQITRGTTGTAYAGISGLSPGTTYEYRLVRRNSVGVSEPVVLSFTTLGSAATPKPAEPSKEPTPSATYIPPSIPPSSPTGGLYYPTCADARTAGVLLPIRKSEQPGIYDANPQLDRDGDGVACEWA
jgi:hypothetical protein